MWGLGSMLLHMTKIKYKIIEKSNTERLEKPLSHAKCSIYSFFVCITLCSLHTYAYVHMILAVIYTM